MNCKEISDVPVLDDRAAQSVVIHTSYAFWLFLMESRKTYPGQYTKEQAFFDLVERKRIHTATSGGGLLECSYNALSKKWNWHRNTVRRFLGDLVRLGKIKITFSKNQIFIDFTSYDDGEASTVSSHIGPFDCQAVKGLSGGVSSSEMINAPPD